MSDIPMQPVNSSSISCAGYEEQTQTMRIEFKSGARYDYAGVPRSVFERFMQCESKGMFFQVNIRANYEFVCVKPRPKKEETSHGQTKEEKDKAKQKAAVKARAERNNSTTRS